MAADTVILGIIIGTLAAIVYSLRVLILLERRIARMDLNIEALTRKVLSEELRIERQEAVIAKRLGSSSARPAKSSAKKTTSKKKTAKKAAKKTATKKTAKKRKR